MFEKGSRYSPVGESTSLNAEGERLCGKDLRFIETTTGEYLHTVHEGERLDLLAYKYYGDSSKWWQISDANPQRLFPTELIEGSPIEGERFSLTHPLFEQRLAALLRSIVELAGRLVLADPALGGTLEALLRDLVRTGQLTTIGTFDEARAASAFRQVTVIVAYEQTAAARLRAELLALLSGAGFHLLDTAAWQQDEAELEAFTFDSPGTKCDWQSLITELARAEGVRMLKSSVGEASLEVFYLGSETTRTEIIERINRHNFQVSGRHHLTGQAGVKFVIPPHTIV